MVNLRGIFAITSYVDTAGCKRRNANDKDPIIRKKFKTPPNASLYLRAEVYELYPSGPLSTGSYVTLVVPIRRDDTLDDDKVILVMKDAPLTKPTRFYSNHDEFDVYLLEKGCCIIAVDRAIRFMVVKFMEKDQVCRGKIARY